MQVVYIQNLIYINPNFKKFPREIPQTFKTHLKNFLGEKLWLPRRVIPQDVLGQDQQDA